MRLVNRYMEMFDEYFTQYNISIKLTGEVSEDMKRTSLTVC